MRANIATSNESFIRAGASFATFLMVFLVLWLTGYRLAEASDPACAQGDQMAILRAERIRADALSAFNGGDYTKSDEELSSAMKVLGGDYLPSGAVDHTGDREYMAKALREAGDYQGSASLKLQIVKVRISMLKAKRAERCRSAP